MKSEKIDRLLSALGRPAQQVYSEQAANTSPKRPVAAAEEDAVKIDPSMRGRAGEGEQSARQAKVDRISAQINAGAYKPKSEEIAVALIKELNIG